VRDVCIRWRSVSDSALIWKKFRFIPSKSLSTEDIVKRLQGMPNLRACEYYGTNDIIGAVSKYCTSLRVLHAIRVSVKPSLFRAAMERLSELSELGIEVRFGGNGCALTEIIGESASLQTLTLFLTGYQPAEVGLLKPIADGCPNLKELAIKFEGDIDLDEQICYFQQRKKLQLVAFGQSGRVSRNFFLAINECTNLEKLFFLSTSIDGSLSQITPIRELQKLSMLVFMFCPVSALEILLTLFPDILPQLSYIGLPEMYGRMDERLNEVLQSCSSVTHLNLEGTNLVSCRGLPNISFCRKLQFLDLSMCGAFSIELMQHVAEGCPQLQHLDVSGNFIFALTFENILNCKNLRTLLMRECDMPDADLSLISSNIPSLLYLYIGSRFVMETAAREALKQAMPRLVIKQTGASCVGTEYYRIKQELTGNVTFWHMTSLLTPEAFNQ
jgi:hypothetical protein